MWAEEGEVRVRSSARLDYLLESRKLIQGRFFFVQREIAEAVLVCSVYRRCTSDCSITTTSASSVGFITEDSLSLRAPKARPEHQLLSGVIPILRKQTLRIDSSLARSTKVGYEEPRQCHLHPSIG